jgi:thioredoxin reductase
VRDQRIAVLANTAMAATYTLLWHQWSPHVTLVTHPDHPITAEQADRLDAVGIDVVDGPAAEALVVDDRLVGLRLADGAELACDAVAVPARVAARAEALEPLGLTPSEFVMAGESVGTYVAADPTGKTEVPGVWVAGNVASPADTVIVAAGAALRTAGMINLDLIEEDADAAVAARAGSLTR